MYNADVQNIRMIDKYHARPNISLCIGMENVKNLGHFLF